MKSWKTKALSRRRIYSKSYIDCCGIPQVGGLVPAEQGRKGNVLDFKQVLLPLYGISRTFFCDHLSLVQSEKLFHCNSPNCLLSEPSLPLRTYRLILVVTRV